MLTAEQIRDLRQAKGLSQVQLAAMAGVDKNTVSSWERGVTKPTRYEGKLARILLSPDGTLGTPSPSSAMTHDTILVALRQATDADLLAEVARRFATR